MRKYILLILSLAVLSSCEVHHLINDPDYRDQMEKDLQARLNGEGNLKQFYQVDDLIITTEEKEALQFLYAYMPLADLPHAAPARLFLRRKNRTTTIMPSSVNGVAARAALVPVLNPMIPASRYPTPQTAATVIA